MKVEGARLEPLGGGLQIYQTAAYRFGTDAVLLAHFARADQVERALDLGTGCGIIPLLLCKASRPARIVGLEIQQEACYLAERSVQVSGVADRVEIRQGDLRQIRTQFSAESFPLVLCNPPYRSVGGGIQNPDAARAIARHEITCTLEDIAAAAAWLLPTGGRLCLCQRPERLCDAMMYLRAAGLEPKRLRLVCQRLGAEPWLFLLEAKRGAKPGLRVPPTLYLEADGMPSPELEAIYGDYRENAGSARRGGTLPKSRTK